MKSAAVLLALASSAFAQSAIIGYPLQDSLATTGTNITVMIEQPVCLLILLVRTIQTHNTLCTQNSLSSSEPVSLVIGLFPCGSESTCPGPANALGSILYQGPFNPQYATPPGSLPPHQNFSVKIPETFAAGYAQLGAAYLSLLGVRFVLCVIICIIPDASISTMFRQACPRLSRPSIRLCKSQSPVALQQVVIRQQLRLGTACVLSENIVQTDMRGQRALRAL